ncbi:potassium voltage-gated channel subfamily H member 4-like [Morone saxatilis]|uniref:potassium voltage-gated channel subfamily H member 4-like n=1 Tax=Morone saxatilis TaxID=34816 RepID=UPI0015E1D03C|nr:potassium voltage-gated channel subfamily H member 4-like [Morone saxatilis]
MPIGWECRGREIIDTGTEKWLGVRVKGHSPFTRSHRLSHEPRLSLETKGDDPDDSFLLCPETCSRRSLLLPSSSSTVCPTPLGNLQGDDLQLQHGGFQNLSHGLHGQSSLPQLSSKKNPDLNPRVVDGMEDNGHTFHFNVEHSGPKASTGGTTQDSTQYNATLLLETEELRQNFIQLNQKVDKFNQEVSEGLHYIIHLLQAHVSSPPTAPNTGISF